MFENKIVEKSSYNKLIISYNSKFSRVGKSSYNKLIISYNSKLSAIWMLPWVNNEVFGESNWNK